MYRRTIKLYCIISSIIDEALHVGILLFTDLEFEISNFNTNKGPITDIRFTKGTGVADVPKLTFKSTNLKMKFTGSTPSENVHAKSIIVDNLVSDSVSF